MVSSLNQWGAHHIFLVKVASNDFVYLMLAISIIWFSIHSFSYIAKGSFKLLILINIFKEGLLRFLLPVGLATAISEGISQIYVRQRPFVTMRNIKLLVPHGADGGMPSHHMVFMMALATSIFLVERRLGYLFIVLTLLTGIARVVAGIHYPSDILVGVLLGWFVTWFYFYFSNSKKLFSSTI
jgi:membrane-associated phospholipid phosphatase